MYKPTLYITVEADQAHFSGEGAATADRTWSFAAPVTFGAADEMTLKLRMKCSNRPYWSTSDATQIDTWENIAGKFLKDKLDSIIDVLNGYNDTRYAHYSEPLHYVWLQLELAPHTISVRLDHDVEHNDYIPDVFALVGTVRELLNTSEGQAFARDGEGLEIFLPSRADAEACRALRAAEEAAYAAWIEATQAAKAPESTEAGEGAEAAEAAESSDVDEQADATAELPEKPRIAARLEIANVEFVRKDGTALVYDMASESWMNPEA